jgi:FkbM family methyltransferase
MTRYDWYRQACGNLGVLNTVWLQLSKYLLARRATVPLRSKHLRFPVYYRPGSTDLIVFHQIFIEREYSCFDDLTNVGLILDLGANVGYSSAYFLSRFPDSFVIAVEPDEANFALLNKNLTPYNGRYKTINAAVWPEKTTLHFEPASLRAENECGRIVTAEASEGRPVPAVEVASLLAMAGGRRISILKVDIEGAERELFSRNTEPWLGMADNICIEIHGEEARQIFDKAVAGRGFAISRSGELIVARGSGPG